MGQKEITREIQKYSEVNNNKNTHIKICGLQPKVLRRKLTALNTPIRKLDL